MFKSLSLLIHRTPWWGLLLGGVVVLLSLVLFSAPLQVWQLTSHAATPEQKRAIQHEINQAFKDGGLSVAEGILSSMKESSKDPERKRELERALNDIARAREDLSSAQEDARQAAREAARDAAESALEAADEAVEAAQESKNDALAALRDKGLDVTATERSFDDLIKDAKAKAQTARQNLEALDKQAQEPAVPPVPVPPTPPSAPVKPGKPVAPASKATPVASAAGADSVHTGEPAVSISIAIDAPVTETVLTPQVREDIRQRVAGDLWRAGVGSVLVLIFIPLFVVLLIAKYFIDRSYRAMDFAAQKSAEAQLSDLQRQMTEARLQALQAQIEPHFLYNTLANVQALTELDPPSANKLVGHLIEYLRAALPKMRASTSTVGQELDRARAYLNILKMRMGPRLDFAVAADDHLLSLAFPPMMLPTLVENAIKHGLEPRREGGRIDIRVTREQRDDQPCLVMRVADTGAGLSEQTGHTSGGVGLSNLRERLRALYGESASFTLEGNEPRGVVATLCIPTSVAAAAAPQPAPAQSDVAAALESGPAGAQAAAAPSAWQRFWGVTRKTHGVWAKLMTRIFLILMVLLVVGFFAGIGGLLTGWMPIKVDDLQIDGLPGMALGSLGLLVAFAILTIVVALLVLLLYSLGFVFAGVLVVLLAAILASLFPVLSPFILIGVIVWALWRKKQRRQRQDPLYSQR